MFLMSNIKLAKRKKLLAGITAFCLLALIGVGVMARNGWLPTTDPLSGKKTGWFGKELPKNAGSTWNPMAAPLPTATPQLSKEYIYAGSRLLAVADANAQEVPPADLAVWRLTKAGGSWLVLDKAETNYQWGQSGDTPVQGDYDGDGKTDFCVYRSSSNTWYIVFSSNGSTPTVSLGATGDVPAPADYDGDGKTDIATFRPSNGYFYVSLSSTSTTVSYAAGQSGDKPAPADYDGDGKADLCVWRDSNHTFYSIKSSTGTLQTITLQVAANAAPVSADYDGDGKADFAVLDGNVWTIRNSSTNAITTTAWQIAEAVPVQNDYDGDGKVDIACWRLVGRRFQTVGMWYILQSHDASTRSVIWGTTGDIPVPAFYRR